MTILYGKNTDLPEINGEKIYFRHFLFHRKRCPYEKKKHLEILHKNTENKL